VLGRMKMLSTPFSEYEKTLRSQFQLMFGRWASMQSEILQASS
jgi:hypothetical protein